MELPNREAPNFLYLSCAVQQVRQLIHPFDGEGRIGNGLHGDVHQLHGVVICRHPVGAEITAALATVNNGPLALVANPYSNGLHDTAAIGFPIAGLNIHMEAAEAVGTMVPMVAGGTLRYYGAAAVLTLEGLGAGVGLIVTFFKRLALVFSVHGDYLLLDYGITMGNISQAGIAKILPEC